MPPPGDQADPTTRADLSLIARAGGQARQFVAGGNQSVHLAAAPPPSPQLHTLPRDVAAFTWRDDELHRLVTARTSGIVAIHTVDGMAGVGKTALVTRAAHLLAPGFPDGRLFVDLHANTPGIRPADPAEVLVNLLACLDQATAHDRHRHVIDLTSALAAYLLDEGPAHLAATLHERALHLYERAGDLLGQANVLRSQGLGRHLTGAYGQASELLERSLALYRGLGDTLGEADAIRVLGQVRHATGHYAQAAACAPQNSIGRSACGRDI